MVGYRSFEGYPLSIFRDKCVGSGIGPVMYAGRKGSAHEAKRPNTALLRQVANATAMAEAAGCHNPKDHNLNYLCRENRRACISCITTATRNTDYLFVHWAHIVLTSPNLYLIS
jgi:hypothetical protein